MNGGSANNSSAECGDVLDAFLYDMQALDHHQSRGGAKKDKSSTKKRSNPSWIKRKRELQSLRDQTQELQTQIKFLQAKRTDSPTEPTSGQVKWKTIVEIEQQQCQASQDENDRLKHQLQLYLQVTRAMHTMVSEAQEQHKELLPKIATRTLRTEMAGRRLLLASPNVFDMLEARINARFEELKWAFEVSDQLTTKAESENVDISYEDDCRVRAVNFSRAQLLPFEESAVSSTIWSIVQLGGFPDGEETRVIERSQDAFAMDTLLTVYLDSGAIQLNSHTVIKRFVTPRGLIVLLESCSYWTAADLHGSGSWSHSTDERGCFMLLGYSVGQLGGTCAASPRLCQLKSEMILTPNEPAHKTSSCIKPRRTVSEIVIPSFHGIIRSRQQFVENALFDNIRGS